MTPITGPLHLLLIVSLLGASAAAHADTTPIAFQSLEDAQTAADDWWKTASFYQIYPRSFKDSTGNGIGDLNGIAERLPYLVELGITATWLSPIFKSPMADFGYDISNYFDIQPEYGTLADFDALIAKAALLGIKIVLDFVPNHTSDEHEWFKLSAAGDEHFADFYVWHPGFVSAEGRRRPPNNWVSVFGKSAWQFNEQRQAFYLHQFSVKQPDLNYRNPKVVAMMQSVLRFWLKRGVAGFRVDAVPFLFEVGPDRDGNYPDEPLSGTTTDPNDWNYLRHVFTTDMDETVDMVYQWRSTLDEHRRTNGGDERVLLTECYSSIDMVMRYYGNTTHQGAHIPFNFAFIEQINNQSLAADYKAVIDTWMGHMPAGRTPNWVFGNHDQHRVAARLGTDRIDAVNMILMTLPGVSVTYNGEEIGMTDVWISWPDTVDPAACNTNASVYERFSRDPERTPFQWDNTTSAGFSSNAHTWLPVADNYNTVNVRAQLAQSRSHLQCFRKLLALREARTMRDGELVVNLGNANVLLIYRHMSGEDVYLTAVNIGPHKERVNFPNFFGPFVWRYVVVSVATKHTEGETVTLDHIELDPYESYVLVFPVKPSPQEKFYNYITGDNV